MDFSLSEEQTMLADSIARFIDTDYDFTRRQENAGSEIGYSVEMWRTFADLGWTAVPFAEEDGGLDGGPIEQMLIMEQFGRGLVVEPYMANVILAGGVLRRVANDEQKSNWLGPLIGGELQATLAFAEHGFAAFLHPQQRLKDPAAKHGARPLPQIRNSNKVGKNIVAIKSKKRISVEQKRAHGANDHQP